MKKVCFAVMVAVFGAGASLARAQHGGHGGHGGMSEGPRDYAKEKEEEAKSRQARLGKLQDGIDELEQQLEDGALPAKKRAKLEKKLKKLYAKKDKILGVPAAEHACGHGDAPEAPCAKLSEEVIK